MTREEHREQVLDSVRDQRERMGPDGDWMPFVLIDAGRVVIMIDADVLPIAVNDAMHATLTAIMRQAGGEHFARIASMWTVDPPEDGSTPERGYAREHPDRRELVMVLLGDAEQMEAVAAYITRTPDAPPELGEWLPATATPQT